ncbi:MAG: sigma-70 family RNA polymerase sigma factor, partial [Verrucomicrobiaceae bacterium]|nr:sigma-70 family RNA polymerase sigma factor [Verrucomicrobiaceae bacterium]
SHEAKQALNELCEAYWRPIYAEIRRRGHTPADAQDLTQEFMARLLRQNSFGRAEESKGRFRSYLLGALDYFLANHLRDQRAQKRGGGMEIVSLDAEEAESWFALLPADGATPAEAFDHGWTMLLMDRALAALEAEYGERGQATVFGMLKPFLATDAGVDGYAETAAQAGMTENSFRVAVHRLRKRFRQCVREQVEVTVADPADTDAEMRHLFGF